MLKRMFGIFVTSLGIFSLVLILGNIFVPNGWIPLKLLYVGATLSLVVAVWWGFLYGKKLSYKKIWLCRSALILLTSLTVCALTLVWNIIEITSIQKRLVFFLGTLVGNFVVTSVSYFAADKIEKNVLKKINTKFENNIDE